MVLAPWPNRVRDGRWLLDGTTQQLDLTEPSLGNASHGLLRNTEYAVRAQSENSIELGARIPPQHGFPFALDTWVRYEVGSDGLLVTHGVENLGDARAPWAVGAHPYLRVGAQPVPELTVTVPAERYLVLDERNLPVRIEAVAGSAVDVSHGERVADVDLNTTYAGVSGDLGWLDGDAGRTTLWADPDFGHVLAYTNRSFPNAEGIAIALEPMTAAPDALNSGEGLRWLAPGEIWTGRWGVRFDPAS
jgi:aldose 1-epimerase